MKQRNIRKVFTRVAVTFNRSPRLGMIVLRIILTGQKWHWSSNNDWSTQAQCSIACLEWRPLKSRRFVSWQMSSAKDGYAPFFKNHFTSLKPHINITLNSYAVPHTTKTTEICWKLVLSSISQIKELCLCLFLKCNLRWFYPGPTGKWVESPIQFKVVNRFTQSVKVLQVEVWF